MCKGRAKDPLECRPDRIEARIRKNKENKYGMRMVNLQTATTTIGTNYREEIKATNQLYHLKVKLDTFQTKWDTFQVTADTLPSNLDAIEINLDIFLNFMEALFLKENNELNFALKGRKASIIYCIEIKDRIMRSSRSSRFLFDW